jgi:hypothetical protein
MDLKHVDDAIVRSYRELRTRIGIAALAFPVALVGWGFFWGLEVQPTLSNYYFAEDTTRIDHYPVRLWFCGILFFVGFFLYRYQGFSKNENIWLSAAGVLAVGVAVFPMSMDGQDQWGFLLAWTGLKMFSMHYICAILAFACIAVVIVWYADDSLSELKDQASYKWFKAAYFMIAAFMVASIALAIMLNYLHHGQGSYILAAEWAGIWAFGAYWFVKNMEMTRVADSMRKKGIGAPGVLNML